MMPFSARCSVGALSGARFRRAFKDPFLRRGDAGAVRLVAVPMMAGLSLLAAMSMQECGRARGSIARVRPLHRAALSGAWRRDSLQVAGREDTGRGRARAVPAPSACACTTTRVSQRLRHLGCRWLRYIFYMLGRKFADHAAKRNYDGHLPVHSQIQVSLGVRRDLSAEPSLGDVPARQASADRRRGTQCPHGQDLRLRPNTGAGRQRSTRSHDAHRLRLLGAHLWPSPVRNRAGTGGSDVTRLFWRTLPGTAA